MKTIITDMFVKSLRGLKMSKGVLRQLLVAFLGSLAVFCGGCCYVWFGPFIVDLTSGKGFMVLSMSQVSLVLSMLDIGSCLSPVPVGFLVNLVGRKPILLFGGPMFIVSWLIVASTSNVESLYIARMIQGMAIGVVFSVLPMYLGEVAGSKIRGRIGLVIQGMVTIGMIYEYSIGPFITYHQIAWVSMVPPLVFMISFYWFPESPHFLVMKQKEREAKAALKWFRGGEDVTDELDEIKRSVEEEKQNQATWKDIVGTKQGRRAILALEVVLVTYEMGGAIAVLNYAPMIFSETSGGNSSSYLLPILMSVLILVLFPIPILSIERLGRRPLILFSTIVAAISNFASGTYYYLSEKTSVDVSLFHWLPYASVILATVTLVCGVEAVKHILQAELFPNSTRGVAGGTVIFSERLMSILSLTTFPIIINNYGIYLNFYIFTIFCVVCYILMYFFLPETKGKSFGQIQKSIQ